MSDEEKSFVTSAQGQRSAPRRRLSPLSQFRRVASGSGNGSVGSRFDAPLRGAPHPHRGCDRSRRPGRTPQLNFLPGQVSETFVQAELSAQMPKWQF